mmetsp:Transcript_13786/g.24624  ORF Transcript_13786/g.24624 Transcript_13786/m.24624 type:complete len:267 (+) Transcript_13786:2-802(+)
MSKSQWQQPQPQSQHQHQRGKRPRQHDQTTATSGSKWQRGEGRGRNGERGRGRRNVEGNESRGKGGETSFDRGIGVLEPEGPPPEAVDGNKAPMAPQQEAPAFEYTPRLLEIKKESESCPRRLATRQKQIDLGKNTLGYQRYLEQVPRKSRGPNWQEHPRTPRPSEKMSKRCFDGIIRAWRRNLHRWDPVVEPNQQVIQLAEEVGKWSVAAKGDEPRVPPSPSAKTSPAEHPAPSEHLKEAAQPAAKAQEPVEKTLFDYFEDDDLL